MKPMMPSAVQDSLIDMRFAWQTITQGADDTHCSALSLLIVRALINAADVE